MSGFEFDDLPSKNFLIQIFVPFIVTLFFLQGFRTFVVDIYIALFNILWEGTGEYLPLLGLLVFSSPILAILVNKKVSFHYMIVGSAVLTALFAIPISIGLPYEIELFCASMVIAFYSVFLPFHLYHRINNSSEISVSGEAALITTGFILAFSYDILFRSFGTTYDLSRALIYFPLQLLFFIILIGLNIWQLRLPDSSISNTHESEITESKEMTKTSKLTGVFTIAGIGAFLFIQHTLLMNPHNLVRWAAPEFFLLEMTLTLIITLIILLLSAILLLHPKLRKYYAKEKWQYLIFYNLLIIIPLVLLFLIGGWFIIIFVLLIQIVIIFDFFLLIRYAIHPSLRWSPALLCAAVFVGFIIFLLWDFMFAFTFTHAYLGDIGTIFAGQEITIVLTAALILMVTSTFSAYKLGRLKT